MRGIAGAAVGSRVMPGKPRIELPSVNDRCILIITGAQEAHINGAKAMTTLHSHPDGPTRYIHHLSRFYRSFTGQ